MNPYCGVAAPIAFLAQGEGLWPLGCIAHRTILGHKSRGCYALSIGA